ncbi:S8 family serine peptidase [Aestuariivivens sediminicola]|uniref:S8 family serine peptidase n=1 Tax=Aestuariivivens sediminicola TaxID=2913560 RepID=UPI001F58F654|nr:S8 family serine peptidase [Aestuariivivens sediminicola]
MVIKTFYFCVFMLIGSSVFSQTISERKKISESYDLAKIEDLKARIQEANVLRLERIENYLKGKSLKKREKRNGKTYTIHDIVNNKPIYYTTHNLNSAKATKTNRLWTGGSLGLDLNGENMILGVWDEEDVRATHQEFLDDQMLPQSRVSFPELAGTTRPASDHATHVAGTLVAKGTNADAKGMAPKALLRSFDWDNDDGEASTEAQNGLLISNHSYGVSIFDGATPTPNLQVSASNIGAYNSDARTWDDVAYTMPYFLAVNSAGNDGADNYTGGLGAGYDKLYGNKTSKNNLVVASALTAVNVTTGDLSFFQHSTFSSQGPTDDFRIKPDITADGENVLSTGVAADNDYFSSFGTSMASPNVAGSLILLQQHYNNLYASYMRAATVKGLICHTAIDDNVKVGPDPRLGWGVLNVEAAADVITNNASGLSYITELTLNDGLSYTYNFSTDASGPIKATICWTDPPGTVSSSPGNSMSPRLVNDLDLRITGPGATVYTPWNLDKTDVTAAALQGDNDVDNIEIIDTGSVASGNYTLTVTHKGTLTDGQQAFSLILTGASLTLNVPDQDLAKEVHVWPNPVDTNLNMRFSKALEPLSTIELVDIQGRTVFSKHLDGQSMLNRFSINVNNFKSGLYVLNISSESYNYKQKILIQ